MRCHPAPRHRSTRSFGAICRRRESKATPLIADLETLSDSIGGRPTGSPALDRAVRWALARFAVAGAENVHAEDYVAPGLWLPGGEAGEVTAPYGLWEAFASGARGRALAAR